MIFSAIFGLLPWYGWVLIVLAVVAVTALGLWAPVLAIARTAVKAFRALPTNVKLLIIGLVALVLAGAVFKVWLNYHDAELTDRITKERDAHWQAREDASNRAYADNLRALHRQLEIADSNAAAAKEKHAAELAARDRRHQAEMDSQTKERSENVTQEAIAACDLRRGVVVHFNTGASRANGTHGPEDPAAAAARAASANEPSGVALDSYVAAVDATQDALGDARNQVIGWQKYHAEVLTPWIDQTLQALSTCIPKGAPAP